MHKIIHWIRRNSFIDDIYSYMNPNKHPNSYKVQNCPHLWEAQIALNHFHFFLRFWFKFSTTEKLGKVSDNSSITYSSSATPYQDTSTSFLQGQKQIHSCLRRRFNIGQNAFQDFSLKAIRQRTSNADIWPTAFIVYVEKHLLKLLE